MSTGYTHEYALEASRAICESLGDRWTPEPVQQDNWWPRAVCEGVTVSRRRKGGYQATCRGEIGIGGTGPSAVESLVKLMESKRDTAQRKLDQLLEDLGMPTPDPLSQVLENPAASSSEPRS